MNAEEACTIILSDVNVWTDETADALMKATEALLKQIPKKIENGKFAGKCACGKFVFLDMNYCPNCGQALDWGNKK